VHFGNEAAAWSRGAWFTHLLCVGEELARPTNLRSDVIFRKIGMLEGVDLALDDAQIKSSVEWIRRVWTSHEKPPTKITQADRKHLLVYSRSAQFNYPSTRMGQGQAAWTYFLCCAAGRIQFL